MSARPHTVPHPALSIGGIALNGCGLFLMPFLVGAVASAFFEVSEVMETGGALVGLLALFILPPLVLQILGVVLKVARERSYLREAGRLTPRSFLATLHRHMRIVTPRGWAALFTGLWFVVLSLSAKWASLGLLAVLSLFLFYSVLGASSFVSTFLVRSFANGLGRGQAGIRRELSPAVVLSGEAAEERFQFARVPVPPFFTLLVEDENPPELATESRYAVGPGAKRHRVTLSGRFRRTPRGLHHLGPARIWYQDALGFTRVSVASLATAELKVLPRFKSLEIIEPPRSKLEAPDVLTRPHRFANEDWFRFKEYAAGDDTRRIQWRLSIRTGRLQVRQPESREISSKKVLLVLDSYLPAGRMLHDAVGMGEILDRLVETFISVARELAERGDQISIAAAVDDGEGNLRVEVLPGSADQRRWQDLGSRVVWQGQIDLPAVVAEVGRQAAGSRGSAPDLHGVAVSSRFFAPPPQPLCGQSFTWVYLPPHEALGKRELPFWEQWVGPGPGAPLRLLLTIVRLPGSAGSDENSFVRQFKDGWRLWKMVSARRRLRFVAARQGARTFKALCASGDTVYRLVPGAGCHRLEGVSSGTSRGSAVGSAA